MLVSKDNVYQSRLLQQIRGLVHGYSTKLSGDMRAEATRETFVKLVGGSAQSLVLSEQVHGVLVNSAQDSMTRKLPAADGLVVTKKGLPIGVIVADCVPLLLADAKKGVAAAVHAGWRGSLGNIAAACVKKMTDEGSSASDIVVSVGPHIGMCCYSVGEERVKKFQAAYGKDPRVASRIGNTWYVDIGYVNVLQLQAAGVLPEHIDAPVVCTSCQSDIFYSYRKDSKESFGEILGFVALA